MLQNEALERESDDVKGGWAHWPGISLGQYDTS